MVESFHTSISRTREFFHTGFAPFIAKTNDSILLKFQKAKEQFYWSRAFAHKSWGWKFSQILDMSRKLTIRCFILGDFNLEKYGSVTFEHLWTPNSLQNIRKNNEPILRKVRYWPRWICMILSAHCRGSKNQELKKKNSMGMKNQL